MDSDHAFWMWRIAHQDGINDRLLCQNRYGAVAGARAVACAHAVAGAFEQGKHVTIDQYKEAWTRFLPVVFPGLIRMLNGRHERTPLKVPGMSACAWTGSDSKDTACIKCMIICSGILQRSLRAYKSYDTMHRHTYSHARETPDIP
eukprot:364942-Chlamydomonas_euryale.AAC.15